MIQAVRDMMIAQRILPTRTGRHDTKANRGAERYIGIANQRATSYRLRANRQISFWYWACRQAAYMLRCKALGIKLPADAPTRGTRVMIRSYDGEEKSFEQKTREATFLCWDTSVVQSAYAMTKTEGSTQVTTASGPIHGRTNPEGEADA